MLSRLVLCFPIFVALAVAADPHDGKWKFNVNKSQLGESGSPKELTIVISEDATSHHIAVNMVGADDKKVSVAVTFPLAGGPAKAVLNGEAVESSVEIADRNTWVATSSTLGKNIYEVKEKELHVTDVEENGEVSAERVFDLQQ